MSGRRSALFALFVLAGAAWSQLPAAGAQQRPAAGPHATLNQLMKGVMFPNSNVVFAVQDRDPASVREDADGSASTSLSSGIYGGWQSVENAGLAMAEAAALLTVPGRACQNGKPAPLGNADWQASVDKLVAAGLAARDAARSRNLEAFGAVSDQLVSACASCHDVYRDRIVDGKPLPFAQRCTK